MDVNQAIRTAVFLALQGSIAFEGKTIPVVDTMDFAEAQPDYPYIILGNQESGQRTAKNRRPYDCLINIDVVTGFLNPEGREDSEMIMNMVDEIINPESRNMIDATPLGWIIGDISQQSSNYLNSRNKMFYIYRKIGTYSIIATRI